MKSAGIRIAAVVAAVSLAALGFALFRLAGNSAPSVLPPAIPATPGGAAGYNVVLITLDTLRADYLGCYGATAVETPALDALARAGVRLDDVVTTAPLTLPAHATILTGKYPPRLGVRNNGTYRLPAAEITLAERLRDVGYVTAAFVSSFVLEHRFGTDQGFERYDDVFTQRSSDPRFSEDRPERTGDAVTDAALDWLDGPVRTGSAKPFLLWLHLYDPHEPYVPPEPFSTRYRDNPYAGEVAFADQQVGRLMERLRERGLAGRTLVVAVGDHGESLGDHGEETHGVLLYEAAVRVPAILSAPGVLAPGHVVVDRVVSLADLFPTILDLLGLDPGRCDGESLVRPGARSERAVYIESLFPQEQRGWSALYALRRHGDKYIAAPTPEYYDFRADPGERENRFERGKKGRHLAAELALLQASFASDGAGGAAARRPDAETVRKLTALGYLRGAAAPSGPPPDPKAVIASWTVRKNRALAADEQGRFTQAIALLQEILAEDPANCDDWMVLAQMQESAGLNADAIQSQLQCVDLDPKNGEHWIRLAYLQASGGDSGKALASLEEAARFVPDDGNIPLLRAYLARKARRWQEALEFSREARTKDPSRLTAASWVVEGSVHEDAGHPGEALRAYEEALRADPGNSAALFALAELFFRAGDDRRAVEFANRVTGHDSTFKQSRYLLAQALRRLGQRERALDALRELARSFPEDPAPWRELGGSLVELNRRSEAAQAYREALGRDPRDAVTHYDLGLTLAQLGDLDGALASARAAVAADPTLAPAQRLLADVLAARGEREEAAKVRSQRGGGRR